MIRALGFSVDTLDPYDPGRLCRGRERWIEPLEDDAADGGDEESEELSRLVLTGAAFSDDSAADALRGLPHAGVELAQVLQALFPRKVLLAFMEDGHPADIPEGAEGVEAYEGYRAGGAVSLGLVRWHKLVTNVKDLREILGESAEDDRVRGFVVLDAAPEGDDLEDLLERVFLLVGMSTLDSPPARYQPVALPEILEVARAVVLLHRDKHGLAAGIYTDEPVRVEGKLDALAEKAGALLVPFAIPPMLARWDRAIAELRANWMATRKDEFPVPPAAEAPPWERGGRGRRGRDRRQQASAAEHTSGEE